MFDGFCDETFEFFMAIRFNNNPAFFHANHDWYERAVRRPARALAEALAETVQEIDPLVETRSAKVVSRINRDVRFSKDKSPYRDYFWLAFRRPGADRKTTLGLYFDLGAEGASYGMGFYGENKPLMNALRRRIVASPGEVLPLVQATCGPFTLMPAAIKRLKVPAFVPEALAPWYPLKGFYVEREICDFDLIKSPALAGTVREGLRLLKPLYQYIAALTPEEELVDYFKLSEEERP